MIREGALSGSYHIHEMGPLSEPPPSSPQSSTQPRTMPLLMTAGCTGDSSGQLPSGPSDYRFTKFILGGGLLSSALDGQPDVLEQAPAATTTVGTLFPCSSRQEILLEELSLATGTHAQLMNMNSGSSFQSAEADAHNTKRPDTSPGSSQLSNGGGGSRDPEKDDLLYNQLRSATSAATDDRNTVNCVDQPLNEATGEWGGGQQPSLIMTELSMIPYQDGRSEKIRPEAPVSHESECIPEHQVGSARSVFLSDGRIAKDEQHSTFNHQLRSEHDHVVHSTAESAQDEFSGCETVAQTHVAHAFPSYNINMLSANPFNFPTGAELLGVPTQVQQSSSHSSRGGSVPNGVPDHDSESVPFGDVGALFPDQNLASRLGAYNNTPPSLKASWTDMASNHYASSSLLSQANHTVGQSNLQAMSRIVGAQAGPSILSEGLQDNHYNHGEPARNREGASYFAPQQTEAVDHAMQLCLSFVVPEDDSEPAVAERRFHRFRSPLEGQRAQLLSQQGVPAPARGQHMGGNQGYSSNWRNGGNELLFIPGSDSTVDTQPFTGQMTDQFQQQAELGISLYGSRRSPTSVNQLHQDSIFQNGDGHAGGHDSQFQGLSLSLSSEQLPSHHERTHEADIDVFAIMSQATAEAKGKRVQECAEGRYNGILSRFRPQRDDQDHIAMPEAVQRVYHYGQSVGAKLGGKHSLLLYPNPDPYMPSSSNIPYGPPVSGSRYLSTNQVLLNNLCTVTKCKKSTGDHLKAQCSNWITQDLSTFHATSANDMGADSNTRKDFKMNAPLLPGRSSSPMGETRAREAALQKYAQLESKEDLESKKMVLRSFLDQVDRRYRAYNELMRDVINHFNSVAGPESAIPYTALALQTMSRQFRRVRDNICGHLRAVKRVLGEEEVSPGYAGRDLSSLRFVDQQLRQQRTMQQLGMLQQHAWRPQRGLPERAVSVLRSWLFEHFLHPYPKDSDKLFLAKQTGLTRSQVSNWFINARVRLWKPMVEEMYLDEFNNSDEGGSGERRNSRERRQEHEAVEYDDANIVTSNFSNGHTETGTVDNQQRITIACGGDGMYNPPSNMRTAHGLPQNASHSNSLSDFDGDQRGGVLKKARNGIHNSDRLGHPIAGMDIDLVSPGSFHGSSRLEGSYRNSAANQDYSQHQDILAAANGGRFSAYLGGNLTGYPGDGGFVSQATASTNGGVSLTLGLRYSDGLSLPRAAAPQPKYSNHDDVTVRNMNNVHSELPLAHLNPSQEDQEQRCRPTSHLFHEFVSQG